MSFEHMKKRSNGLANNVNDTQKQDNSETKAPFKGCGCGKKKRRSKRR